MLLSVHAHVHVATSQGPWTRLHNRRSLFIRPPLPPPHASGRPVTWPDHNVRILDPKLPDDGPLVAVRRWLSCTPAGGLGQWVIFV